MLSKLLSASLLAINARESTLEDLRSGLSTPPKVEGLLPKGCKFAVNRLKSGPENWPNIVEKGKKYTDNNFKRRDMLYTFPYSDWMNIGWYNFDLFLGDTKWVRLGEQYPNLSLYGAGTDWLDAI